MRDRILGMKLFGREMLDRRLGPLPEEELSITLVDGVEHLYDPERGGWRG